MVTKAATPEDIYSALVASPELMALVGTYTFANGSTSPSISIVSPGQNLPALQQQTGLEVVIHDSATATPRMYISNASDLVFEWNVYLMAWAPAYGSAVTEAVRLISGIFPMADAVTVSSIDSTMGVSFQQKVRISSDSPLVAAGTYIPGIFEPNVFL
jgi:hypothetical protein